MTDRLDEIIKNIGWWGKVPSDGSGIIVWPKRKLDKLLTKTPEVGDTIIDERSDKLIGFTVEEVDNGGGLITDDYYLKVIADGYYYEDQPTHPREKE